MELEHTKKIYKKKINKILSVKWHFEKKYQEIKNEREEEKEREWEKKEEKCFNQLNSEISPKFVCIHSKC